MLLDTEALRRALSALAQASPYGVAVTDASSTVLHANPALASMLGVALPDLLGTPLTDFVHPDDRGASPVPLGEVRAHGAASRRRRRRLVRADGAELAVTLLVTPVPGPDGGNGHVVLQILPDSEHPAGPSPGIPTTQATAVEEAAAALTGAATVQDVTDVMERQLPAFEATGLLISLAEGPHLRLVSHRGYPDVVLSSLVDQPMAGSNPMSQVIRDRAPRFVETLEDYVAAYPQRETVARLSGKQAWAFLPMVAGGRVIGCWCLSFDTPHRFPVAERALLATLSGLLAQAVARSQVLAAERSLTRTLQRSLLPAQLPEVSGCRIAVRYTPAVAGLEVGGDFYDVVPLPDGGAGIVIGDAQGHSAAAAAVMGQVRSALRAYAAEGHDPATIMARTNRFLVTADIDTFVTCTYAALDAARAELTVVRAGHPEPLLVGEDGAADWVTVAGGLPIGVDPQATYPVTRVRLSAGCRVVLYTDGLVEQRGRGLDIGEADLVRRVGAAASLPLEGFADAVLGPPVDREDDVAVLVLERVADTEGDGVERATFTAVSSDRRQVGAVRREVSQRCTAWGWATRADEVELLVSELLTNAVVHVGGTVSVTVTASRSELTVAVADTSVHAPEPGQAGLWDTSGRGLGIVRAVADRWGVDPSGPGKSVWFALSPAR